MPAFIYKPPKDLEFTESGPSSEKTYARRRRTTENGNDNGYFNSETVTNAAPKCQPITNYDYVAWISIFSVWNLLSRVVFKRQRGRYMGWMSWMLSLCSDPMSSCNCVARKSNLYAVSHGRISYTRWGVSEILLFSIFFIYFSPLPWQENRSGQGWP